MLPVGLLKHVDKLKFLVNENSTTILTGLGVSGTIATAVLTGRSTFKAARLIDQEEAEGLVIVQDLAHDNEPGEVQISHKMSRMDKVRWTWKLYLPPVGVGILTITSIVMAHKTSARQIAALTVSAGISERALKEYKEKVLERIGPKQDVAIRDQIAQERVNKHPVTGQEVILAGSGEVLCYDMTTDRYFQSTVEDIKRAENKINYDVLHYNSVSLSEFYDEIGLRPTSYSDQVGWNMDNNCELVFSTTMSSDQRPCIAIDFAKQPISGYDKIYG